MATRLHGHGADVGREARAKRSISTAHQSAIPPPRSSLPSVHGRLRRARGRRVARYRCRPGRSRRRPHLLLASLPGAVDDGEPFRPVSNARPLGVATCVGEHRTPATGGPQLSHPQLRLPTQWRSPVRRRTGWCRAGPGRGHGPGCPQALLRRRTRHARPRSARPAPAPSLGSPPNRRRRRRRSSAGARLPRRVLSREPKEGAGVRRWRYESCTKEARR